MREYMAILKRDAGVIGSFLSAWIHHPDARTAWAVGIGLAIVAAVLVAWQYYRATPVTSLQTEQRVTIPASQALPPADMPAISNSTQMNSTTSADGHVQSKLRVNNQPIAVPSNGTVHKTIKQDGNRTTIDVSSQTRTTGSSTTSSSLTVNVNSQTDTSSTTGGSP